MRTPSQKEPNFCVFRDRAEAGRMLAERLMRFAARPDVVVLALPPGGVPVGFEIAHAVVAPLDVFLVRELLTPGNPEIVTGTITSGGIVVLNPDMVHQFNLSDTQIQTAVAQVQRELESQERRYRSNRPPLKIRSRTIILVDDGLSAPSTMLAATLAVRNQGPYWITIAIPVLSSPVHEELRGEFDEVVCLVEARDLETVGQYYRSVTEVSEEQGRELLAQAADKTRAA